MMLSRVASHAASSASHRLGPRRCDLPSGALFHLVGELAVEVTSDVTPDGLQGPTGQSLPFLDPSFLLAVEAPGPEVVGGGVDVAGRDPQPQATLDPLRGLLLRLGRCLDPARSGLFVRRATGSPLAGALSPLGHRFDDGLPFD